MASSFSGGSAGGNPGGTGTFSSSGPTFNPGSLGLYNQMLGLNTEKYNQILGTYSQNQANLQSGGAGIDAIYGGLGKDNVALAEQRYNIGARDINDTLQQTLAQQRSAAVNSGFRSSAQLALQNQVAGLAGRNIGDLSTNIQSQLSNQQTQIGEARAGARQGILGLQSGAANSYMGNLTSFNFNPQVPLYGQQSYSQQRPPIGYGGGSGGRASMPAPFGGAGFGNPMAGSGYNAMGYTAPYQQFQQPGYQNPYSMAPTQDFTPGSGQMPIENGFDYGDSGSGGDY